MTRTRKVARTIAWGVAGIAGVALVLCAITLLANTNDQPPSDAALKLRNMLESRNQVADTDNAYVFVLGFSSPAHMDPHVAGAQRLAWLKQRGYVASTQTDLFPGVDLTKDQPKEIAQLAEACRTSTLRCASSFEANGEVLSWLNSQALLLDRYRTLLTKREWLEFVSGDVAMPLPSYHHVLDGQRMYFASLWLSTDSLDAPALRSALQADLEFWRAVLASSDYLITKMIAVAAIRQHFAFGNLLIRRLTAESMEGVPISWHEEISAEERSMLRVMTGEFKFAEGILSDLDAFGLLDEADELDLPVLLRSGAKRLSIRTYQYQDTVNQFAARYLEDAQRFDVPWDKYPDAIADSQAEIPKREFTRFYNIIGDYLFDVGAMQVGGYAARVGDLEGMRRAVLLAAELRSRAVPVDRITVEIEKSKFKNQYTNRPFEWDANESAVVFVGLEEGERGRHGYVY